MVKGTVDLSEPKVDLATTHKNVSVRDFTLALFSSKDPLMYGLDPNRITLKDLSVPGTNPGEILLYIYMTGAAILFGFDKPVNKLSDDEKKTMNKYMRGIDVEAKFLGSGSNERLEFHPLT